MTSLISSTAPQTISKSRAPKNTRNEMNNNREESATSLPSTTAMSNPNMSDASIELRIDGMTCSHCERAVRQAIIDVQGVDRVDVDLQRGTAIVHGTADTPAVISAVEEEGYTARIISSHHRHG